MKKRPSKVIQTIEEIHKQFENSPQWLLIRVHKMDHRRTLPIDGELLAHDPDRDVIYRKISAYKGLLMTDHSHSGQLPSGRAYAL